MSGIDTFLYRESRILKENDMRGEVFLTKGSKIFVDPNQAIGCTYTGVGSAPTMTCSCHSRNIL